MSGPTLYEVAAMLAATGNINALMCPMLLRKSNLLNADEMLLTIILSLPRPAENAPGHLYVYVRWLLLDERFCASLQRLTMNLLWIGMNPVVDAIWSCFEGLTGKKTTRYYRFDGGLLVTYDAGTFEFETHMMTRDSVSLDDKQIDRALAAARKWKCETTIAEPALTEMDVIIGILRRVAARGPPFDFVKDVANQVSRPKLAEVVREMCTRKEPWMPWMILALLKHTKQKQIQTQ